MRYHSNNHPMTNVKHINKFVIAFLESNDNNDLKDLWVHKSTQRKLKTLFNKLKKDPNRPKRPKSAYLFFCSRYRNRIKEDLGPDAKTTDITCELGRKWNKLKTNKRKKTEYNSFIKLAEQDKERYIDEKSTYVCSPEFMTTQASNGPKRPKSAYIFFCLDKRDLVKQEMDDDAKATEITSELGRRWNLLKKAGKISKYESQANEDKIRYQTELDKGGQQDEVVEEYEVVDETNAPKKLNSYQNFCQKHRLEFKNKFPNAKSADITKKLSVSWKALSKEERSAYKQVRVSK